MMRRSVRRDDFTRRGGGGVRRAVPHARAPARGAHLPAAGADPRRSSRRLRQSARGRGAARACAFPVLPIWGDSDPITKPWEPQVRGALRQRHGRAHGVDPRRRPLPAGGCGRGDRARDRRVGAARRVTTRRVRHAAAMTPAEIVDAATLRRWLLERLRRRRAGRRRGRAARRGGVAARRGEDRNVVLRICDQTPEERDRLPSPQPGASARGRDRDHRAHPARGARR